MGTPSLGLVGALGASGASEGLEGFLKQRIEQALMQRQQAEQERRARAQEAAEAARLAQAQAQMQQQGDQFSQRHALDTEELGERRRQFDAGSNQRGLDLMKGEAEIGEITNARSAREALKDDPVYGKVVGLRSAGVQTVPIDPMDPMGDIGHGRRKELTTLQGDQNVRSAREARAGRTVTIQTVDEQGRPVRRVVPIDEAVGQDFAAPPTADMRNREAGSGRANAVLDAIGELSERINTQQGVIATMRGTAEKAKAQVNLSDDVSEYEAVVSGFTPLLARAVGHTGVLTEQDVQSVRRMLPSPRDSKSVRDRKIARINSLMGSLSGEVKSGSIGTGESLDTNPPAETAEFDYVPGKGLVPRK